MTQGKDAWERRAKGAESALQQVLFRNWPAELNLLLHRWHVSLVSRALTQLPREGVRVLDLGCGPGRLAGELASQPVVSEIVGVDHASSFLDRFEAACMGKGMAYALDFSQEPIPGKKFHLALMVASLMYIPACDQEALLARVFESLVPTGRLLLVENDARGVRASAWWGLLHRKRNVGNTPDHVFLAGELRRKVMVAGGEVIWELGLPLVTLSLPLLWGIGRTAPRALAWLAPCLLSAEATFGPSLQRALLVRPASCCT